MSDGFDRAIEVLRRAATPHGFVASTTQKDNYRRIWARDGVISSLAALLLDDQDLEKTVLATLRTLLQKQGPHGEIPSNVDPEAGHVSFGGTAGRVDANLWWLIGCHRYWQTTQDERFLEEFMPAIKRTEHLLGAWEFNTKGLLYVPETGDWADEYIQHGYVLYDQLLYWRALTGVCDMYCAEEGTVHHVLQDHAQRVRDLIQANYWFDQCEVEQVDAYHPVLFAKGCQAAETKAAYWMPFFSPTGYGYRFDGMANALVGLLKIASEEQAQATDEYIEKEIVNAKMKVLPAFAPVIDENDPDWSSLQVAYSNTFKNKPYEYHNGGLWPLVNGFYVADLAQRGQRARALEYLEGTHAANQLGKDGEEWGFYEFIHGQTLKPGGTRFQTWSATAAIIGHQAVHEDKYPF